MIGQVITIFFEVIKCSLAEKWKKRQISLKNDKNYGIKKREKNKKRGKENE